MKILRSEDEITHSWKQVSDGPVVSICCIAYNQERYIAEAIEGFLQQETDFPFEILIHDDASTDGTAAIIKYYESKYPKIIRGIYQESNKYSKGVKINATFVLPEARGEFLALCEGDDFWVHPKKLARQLAALKKHDVDLVFNPSVTEIYSEQNIVERTFNYGYWGGVEKRLSLGVVFMKGGGGIPAASIFVRKEALFGPKGEYSEFLRDCLTHFYWQVLGTIRAGAFYLPDHMTVYRKGRAGSWTQEDGSHAKRIKNIIDFLARLNRFDRVTQHRYRALVRGLRFKKMVSALRGEGVTSCDIGRFFAEVRAGRVERFMLSFVLLALRSALVRHILKAALR